MARHLIGPMLVLLLQSTEGSRIKNHVFLEEQEEEESQALVSNNDTDGPQPDDEVCAAVIHRRRNLLAVQVPVAILFAGAWVAGGHYIFTAGELVISAILPATAGSVPGWMAGIYELWYSSALILDGVESVAVGLAGSNAVISRYERGEATAEELLNATRADHYIAYGAHRPRCCCDPESDEAACMVLPAIGNQIDCPEGTERQPGRCQIQEVINFSPEETVHGCRCLNMTDCGTNSPHNGHSWCEVETGNGSCGTRFSGSFGQLGHAKRWDLCMMTGAPLRAMLGFDNATRNDFLASFIPNEHLGEHHSMLPSATNVITRYETVAYRDSWTSPTECFIGLPSETLSACAERCLAEGAQGYNNTGGRIASRHTEDSSEPDACVAFAYSPSQRTCVVLPERAQDSKLTPFVSSWENPQGWQHFTLKSHLRCRAGVLFDIVNHYEIARHHTDRFVHLQCKDDASGQSYKASCDEHVCDGAPWCFVPDTCEHHSRRHHCAPIAAPECPVSS